MPATNGIGKKKRRKIHENEKRLDEVIKYSNELNEASRLRKEIIREAQQKARTLLPLPIKPSSKPYGKSGKIRQKKEKTRQIRLQMEAEKQRLLSEAAHEEEERIRKKMEKLKNREKKKKEKQTQTSPILSNGNIPATTVPMFQKGDWVCLPNQAIGEIIELNDKNAVIALGNLRTNARLTQLKKASASQAKKISRPSKQASFCQHSGKHEPKKVKLQTGH
ncbi:MAG: hypothetical protein V8S95_10480 [Odoribacter sp.]